VRNLCSRSEPVRVALERHTELVVVHTQIAVAAARDRFRHDLLHLLGHDADIGLVAAVVAEAIEAEAVVEVAEQRDVVLEHDVGPASATAATATAATTHAATTTTHATTGVHAAAAATASRPHGSAAATTDMMRNAGATAASTIDGATIAAAAAVRSLRSLMALTAA
jgi:hypothetical protein